VGIENNTGRDFKDVEGRLGKTKALKKNNRECNGIPCWTLNGTLFPIFIVPAIPSLFSFSLDGNRCRLWVKFDGADGKPMIARDKIPCNSEIIVAGSVHSIRSI
jgi:hypothetical protein